VRPGTVLPVGDRDDRPDYEYATAVTLHVYELPDGACVRTSIPSVTGAEVCSFLTRRDGDRVSVERTGPPAPWRLLLVGRRATPSGPPSLSAGTVADTEHGCLVDLPESATACEVTLDAG
jgi:alpha-D-xyloside xylohydrolase